MFWQMLIPSFSCGKSRIAPMTKIWLKINLKVDALNIASKISFSSNAKFRIGLPLKDLGHDAEYERSYHLGIQLRNCTPSKLFPRA